jgi:hypothetical protein
VILRDTHVAIWLRSTNVSASEAKGSSTGVGRRSFCRQRDHAFFSTGTGTPANFHLERAEARAGAKVDRLPIVAAERDVGGVGNVHARCLCHDG